jgi:hypothetical protein
MVIEYKISFQNGELTVTQRVECGSGAAATKTEPAADKDTTAAANQQKAAPTAAPRAEVLAKRESYQLGPEPQHPVKPPRQPSTSQPVVIVTGPIIVTADALEGGSGEPPSTSTD